MIAEIIGIIFAIILVFVLLLIILEHGNYIEFLIRRPGRLRVLQEAWIALTGRRGGSVLFHLPNIMKKSKEMDIIEKLPLRSIILEMEDYAKKVFSPLEEAYGNIYKLNRLLEPEYAQVSGNRACSLGQHYENRKTTGLN